MRPSSNCFPAKIKPLLVGRDAFLVLDFRFDVVDGVEDSTSNVIVLPVTFYKKHSKLLLLSVMVRAETKREWINARFKRTRNARTCTPNM